MDRSRWIRTWQYLAAIGVCVVALGIKLALSPTLGQKTPFLLFFAAVSFSAWYGGTGPAVLAIVLSALLAKWFFLAPFHTFMVEPSELLRMLSFSAEASLVAFLSLQLRQAREAAEQGVTQAETALRVREEFLAIASHELKTPLTSLHLDVLFLRRLLGATDQKLREELPSRIERVARQTTRLTALVNSLFDVSRLSSGMLTLVRADVELGELVQEVVERLAPEAAQARCVLNVEAPHPIHGQWDRLRLEQVVTNLLGNAIKYGAGAPVDLLVDTVDGLARLRVRDRGTGIPPEAQARIFGRFERAASPQHFGGLGLGLYISRQIAEAHGGTLGVESTPGQGSTFILMLPLESPGSE